MASLGERLEEPVLCSIGFREAGVTVAAQGEGGIRYSSESEKR